MTIPNIKVRGAARGKGIPSGYILGRFGPGTGDVQLLQLSHLRSFGLASRRDLALTRFTDLFDVPNAYTGAAGKVVSVKATEDGLEFTASSGGTETEYAVPVDIGPHVGTALADNFFFGRAIICPRAGTINSIKFYAQAAQALNKVTPAIYVDSAGSPGAMSQQGAQVTGIVQGLNKFPLSAGVTVTKGQVIWIGFQYLVNGGAIANLATTINGAAQVFFYSGALQTGTPTGLTYTTRGWGSMWASADT